MWKKNNKKKQKQDGASGTHLFVASFIFDAGKSSGPCILKYASSFGAM